jgi:hypothetical protein
MQRNAVFPADAMAPGIRCQEKIDGKQPFSGSFFLTGIFRDGI